MDGVPPEPQVRAQVAESWFRSAAAGVRVESVDAPITLPEGALRDYREAHPLAQVFPLLDDVLGQAARDSDAIMAVADALMVAVDRMLADKATTPGAVAPVQAIVTLDQQTWAALRATSADRNVSERPGTGSAASSILVPGRCGRSVFRMAIGTPLLRQGRSERGCSTFAPVVAISCAS